MIFCSMVRSSIPGMEGAGNEDKDTTERCSLHSSMESFISAVASKDELASFDVMDAPPQSFKPLISPALASLYGEHLRRSTCKNWKFVTSRDLNRRCSLLTNLKVLYSFNFHSLYLVFNAKTCFRIGLF